MRSLIIAAVVTLGLAAAADARQASMFDHARHHCRAGFQLCGSTCMSRAAACPGSHHRLPSCGRDKRCGIRCIPRSEVCLKGYRPQGPVRIPHD